MIRRGRLHPAPLYGATLVAALLLLIPTALRAGSSDLFGFSARSIAMGGSIGAAGGGDAAVAFNNISGIAFEKKITAEIGGLFAAPNLTINNTPQDTADITSAYGGAVFPVLKNFAAGFAFYSPVPTIATIRLVTPTEAHFFKYDEGDILSFAFGAAYHYRDVFAVGIGSLVAMSGSGRIDAATDIVNYRLTQTDIAMGVSAKPAPMIGLTFKPAKIMALGLSARGETMMDFKLDGKVGLGITDLNIATNATLFYHPYEIETSFAFFPSRNFTLSADLVYALWSRAPKQMGLSITPTALLPELSTDYPDLGFVDVAIPSFGIEYAVDTFTVRMGYRLYPTPVPQQTGITNYLDCTEQAFSIGFGFLVDNPLLGRKSKTRIDIFAQYRALSDRDTYKTSSLDPIGDNIIGGSVLSAGGGVNIEF